MMKQDPQSVKDIEAMGTANKTELDHWKSRCAKLERDAALSHISADTVLSAPDAALLPSPVLSAASSSQAMAESKRSAIGTHQPSEERFAQLLTTKNRQVASLQSQITSMWAAQPLPNEKKAVISGPSAQRSDSPQHLASPAAVVAAPRSSSVMAYQETEQAALGLLEEAEADFGLLLPEGYGCKASLRV
jgi:hypothetical protein